MDLEKYLQEKGGGAPAPIDLEAYLREKQQTTPPPIVPAAPRGPGPWADGYVGARPDRPKPTGLVDPTAEPMAVDAGVGVKPTADEDKEFSDAGLSTKLWRLLKGDLPHQRASKRYFDALGEKNPGWKGVTQLESAGRAAVTAGFSGGLAGMGLKALAGAGPAISTGSKVLNAAVPIAARIGSAGIEGGVGGAVQGGLEARDEGQPVLPAALEGAKSGVEFGTALGTGGEAASASGRALANFIRGGRGPTGQDIRLLEKHGYTPGAPLPGHPVARLDDMPGRPRSPSEAFGVDATPAGRGEVGARAAVELQGELARREALSRDMLKAARARNNRPGGQGERVISAEPLIATTGGEMESVAGQTMPGIRSNMERTRNFLADKVEPSQEMYPFARAGEQRGSVGGVEERLERPIEIHPADVEYHNQRRTPVDIPGEDPSYTTRKIIQPDPNPIPDRRPVPDTRPAYENGKEVPQDPLYGEHSVIPGRPMFRGGERLPMPSPVEVQRPLPTTHLKTLPEEYTASAGGKEPIVISHVEHPGFETRATTAEPGERVVVPTGDVHGRVGDAPNRVRPAHELDKLRDALDEMSNIAEREGMSKRDLPMARVADQIRAQLREHAPDVARANSRYHTRMNRTERARELMKDEQSFGEAFGGQLAAQGEQGSRIAGTRVPRMSQLREEFPTRPGFPRQKVEELMDRAPLLGAEERMTPKRLALRGPVGGNVLNIGEPLVARGIYPAARALQAAGVDMPAGLLAALAQAQRGRADDEKKKAEKKR